MKRKARRRRKRRIGWGLILCVSVLTAVGLFARWQSANRWKKAVIPDWIEQDLLTNPNARNGKSLEAFNGIVIHYVGNAGTTAINNRNYFNQESTEVSSHFVVGLEGEIIQCIPLTEQSAASNNRNRDTISVEVCHPTEDGQFSPVTYDSVVKLTAWLCSVGNLSEKDVIRHYDITGKQCPLYYVQNEEAWTQFRQDVADAIKQIGKTSSSI